MCQRGAVEPSMDQGDTARFVRQHSINHNLERPWAKYGEHGEKAQNNEEFPFRSSGISAHLASLISSP